MNNECCILSDSGVKVYVRLEYHPKLKGTDLRHPDFLRKLEELFKRGKVKGLPIICSENSEDALTWHHFSPLLKPSKETESWLRAFLLKALEGRVSQQALDCASEAQLRFWLGRKTPDHLFYPPPSRTRREGPTEVDVTIELERQALVFVEAKYQSDITSSTTYDRSRDQIIRNIDVGSWQARQRGFREFYFILITPDRNGEKAYTQMMDRYRLNPEALREMLPYRNDLADNDFETLAANIGWIIWEELPV